MRTSSSGDTSRSHKTLDADDDDMDVNFKVLCDEVTRKFIEFQCSRFNILRLLDVSICI